jgi:MerR family transcriptional regulator, light-induced transcriptional regulator
MTGGGLPPLRSGFVYYTIAANRQIHVHQHPQGYNIGAVSRLTGIARERIRIWERRYDAVVPHRDAANNRLYSQADVDRLILIRRLVDGGQAISHVARLSLAELEARLTAATPAPSSLMPERVLAFGPEAAMLGAQLRDWGLVSVSELPDASAATVWLAGQSADLVLAAIPTVTHQELTSLLHLHRSAPRTPLLLVYRFAPHRLLDQLARIGIRAVKAPLQGDDLGRRQARPAGRRGAGTAGASLTTPAGHDYRTRQFTAAELQRLGSRADAVACECPQHLANLVRDLQAFEDYTLACEAATPADAALHRQVYEVIARARALTEDALGIVAAEEQMLLPGD